MKKDEEEVGTCKVGGALANLFSTQAIQNGKRMPSPTDGYHGCY